MKLIYEAQGTLNPTCSKSHVIYSFFVDQQYDHVTVEMEYDPKELKDEEKSKELLIECVDKYGYERIKDWRSALPLLNHITLSIDDPDGFRGATHRHFTKIAVEMNDEKSSDGINTKENPRGQWKVTLDIHSMITENCQYQLKVWGENNE